MSRKRIVILVLALVVTAAGGALGVRALGRRRSPKPARTHTVQRGDVEIKVTETGTIEPLKKVEVKSKVGGRIARLLVKEGERVPAGALLAEIEPTEINSRVDQIRAQLDGAKARLAQTGRNVTYQKSQTVSSVRQAEEALRSARARLRVAETEDRAQPDLTASAVAQARANLQAAHDALTLLKNSTHPQVAVQARSSHDEARVGAENARRNLDRQMALQARGYVPEQVVESARADLAAAKARLDQAKKRLDLLAEQHRLELADAQSRVTQAEAGLKSAEANGAQVAIRTEEVQAARAAVAQAEAQLKGAQSGTEQDRMRQDDVAEARASLRQLENQLREVLVRQQDTRLIAPMAGVVTKRYLEEGELVASGSEGFSSGTPVVQIADLSRMLVKLSVNEVDVHRIAAGLPVEITIDAARGVTFAGRVTQVSPAAQSAAGAGGGQQPGQQESGGRPGGVIRFAVEVGVDRADTRLKPGMSARCTIVIARRRGVLRLPTDGVSGDNPGATAQVVTKGVKEGKPADVVTRRPVTLGLKGDNFIEILTGLREGERVKPVPFTGPKRQSLDVIEID